MIVADFSIVPMGSGTRASKFVKAVYELLEESGIKYMPGPMSTSIEVNSFDEIFQVIREANEKVAKMGVQRMITTVRIDYRLDKDISIDSKLRTSKTL